ncbi:class II aldolase/adducin domain protein [Penicillium verrucosum]|uniref:class II aldolase/adducin domain protein n=1 Tax=Penicillium verrucosum TaxID=60171 RepID=UPI002544F336|nr:class II aldolase/adducin domain protein [Penicillium verrucosum]KAJ5939988.1 class II aldolase/adducin domain protein [Penicillium verrucosum]
MTDTQPLSEVNQKRERTKQRLAGAFRIFARYNYDEGIAGHITARDPLDPTTFWVNPLGLAFSVMKASDLLHVNEKGEVIGGGSCRALNTAAFMIHSAIHTARPDVVCAAHSHSVHGRAFCALGQPLDMISQDACAFYNDHVVYDQFNGIVLSSEEGKRIASELGTKKAALLQNHGLLTVGKSIEEAVFWFVSLDKCCYGQLLADAAAAGRRMNTVKISEKDARYTYENIGSDRTGALAGKALFDTMDKETGGDYIN